MTVPTNQIKNLLSEENHYKLYIALPMRFGEDSETIDYCLEKLGFTELTDDQFDEIYLEVRKMVAEEYQTSGSRR